MNPLLFNNMPPFIKKEMEKITEQIQPLMKKNSKYVMFAFPLMLVGGINLLILFIQNAWNMDMVTGLYALMTAIGLALYKESKHVNKRIHQIGKEHMIKRIKTSRIVADEKKKAYVKLVKEHSKMSLKTFFNFLNEENKQRQNLYS
mgnify:CR=1 FL=1